MKLTRLHAPDFMRPCQRSGSFRPVCHPYPRTGRVARRGERVTCKSCLRYLRKHPQLRNYLSVSYAIGVARV